MRYSLMLPQKYLNTEGLKNGFRVSAATKGTKQLNLVKRCKKVCMIIFLHKLSILRQ
jgi:hypothetical protein